MTLADDLAALIAAREAAAGYQWPDLDSERDEVAAFFEAHGAELAALVAENARLRAALRDAVLSLGYIVTTADGDE